MNWDEGDRAFDFRDLGVLCVSESAFHCHLVAGLLITFGFEEIYEAGSASEALERLRSADPDLVIMDAQPGEMSAEELTREIRHGDNVPDDSVPIIMLSSMLVPGIVDEARDAGVTELLEKPLTPASLWHAIEMVVDKPRLFIRAESYVGPDRRRFIPLRYSGPERRRKRNGEKQTRAGNTTETQTETRASEQGTEVDRGRD